MEGTSLPCFSSAWRRFPAKFCTSFHLGFIIIQAAPMGWAFAWGASPFYLGRMRVLTPPVSLPQLTRQWDVAASASSLFSLQPWDNIYIQMLALISTQKTPAAIENLCACEREQRGWASRGPPPLELLWRVLGNSECVCVFQSHPRALSRQLKACQSQK